MKRKIGVAVGVILIILISVFGILYLVDLDRMSKNEPVLFSTWGRKYAPPVEKSTVNTKNMKIVLSLEDEITENSVAVYNSNSGSFENISLTDFAGFETSQQPAAQTKATTNGLLFDASDRAKAAIKPLIESLAGARKDKYTITIN